MVPETHEITLDTNEKLASYFISAEFANDVVAKLRSQYEVDVHVKGLSSAAAAQDAVNTNTETLSLSFTRNNAGGLKDAIDFLTAALVAHGLDVSSVRGGIPRPKSDSFEDSLPFFDSKLLHPASASETSLVLPGAAESPTRSAFGDDAGQEPNVRDRSFLNRIRKPGSITSLSSFLDRRKNGSRSPATGLATYMKHASSNASKASLVSIESQTSNYRNPWNDSGVNLADEDPNGGWPARFGSASGSSTGVGQLDGAKSPFGASSASLNLGVPVGTLPPPASKIISPGDATPRSDFAARISPDVADSPAGEHRQQHGPIGPPQ